MAQQALSLCAGLVVIVAIGCAAWFPELLHPKPDGKHESHAAAGASASTETAKGSTEQEHLWLKQCNIRRIRLPENGILRGSDTPYIAGIFPPDRNARLTKMLTRDSLLQDMGDQVCTPSRAGNVRKDIIEMTVRDYMDNWIGRDLNRNAEENRYIFGEFGDQWKPYREAYNLPPCKVCTHELAAVTIGLGGLHSGAPWHSHGASFIEVLHGGKYVAVLPPRDPIIPHVDEVIKNLTQFHWNLEARPKLDEAGHLGALQACTIYPGEVLYLPAHWHHGVVNTDAYTAFVSSFVPTDEVNDAAWTQ
eukprot:TRINITY_DN83856_c0_g1_i1.p1 TRINITY_DN83856_c0_g1~~TRINITY_DN83856_c0_g1_i1.p1  ORF type:complete len:305 (-),score=25.97 TRINITY_DN83856_c0_g1_i1:686-1600(-)